MHSERIFSISRSPSHLQSRLEIFQASPTALFKFYDTENQVFLHKSTDPTKAGTQVTSPTSQKSELCNSKLDSVTKKSSLYNIIGKGTKTDLNQILELESEFKCYFRPLIQESQSGWKFIVQSMNLNKYDKNDEVPIYSKIYKLRQFIQQEKTAKNLYFANRRKLEHEKQIKRIKREEQLRKKAESELLQAQIQASFLPSKFKRQLNAAAEEQPQKIEPALELNFCRLKKLNEVLHEIKNKKRVNRICNQVTNERKNFSPISGERLTHEKIKHRYEQNKSLIKKEICPRESLISKLQKSNQLYLSSNDCFSPNDNLKSNQDSKNQLSECELTSLNSINDDAQLPQNLDLKLFTQPRCNSMVQKERYQRRRSLNPYKIRQTPVNDCKDVSPTEINKNYILKSRSFMNFSDVKRIYLNEIR